MCQRRRAGSVPSNPILHAKPVAQAAEEKQMPFANLRELLEKKAER
jgi:hypothetical protein